VIKRNKLTTNAVEGHDLDFIGQNVQTEA